MSRAEAKCTATACNRGSYAGTKLAICDLQNQTALIARRSRIAGIANQFAHSFLNFFPTNIQSRIVVELVFLAQLLQIVTFFAFFLYY